MEKNKESFRDGEANEWFQRNKINILDENNPVCAIRSLLSIG